MNLEGGGGVVSTFGDGKIVGGVEVCEGLCTVEETMGEGGGDFTLLLAGVGEVR